MIARNCQVDLELTSVTHVARWDILLETRYVQLVVKRVQSVAGKGIGQLAVEGRLRAKRVIEHEERKEVNRGGPVIRGLSQSQVTAELIK